MGWLDDFRRSPLYRKELLASRSAWRRVILAVAGLVLYGLAGVGLWLTAYGDPAEAAAEDLPTIAVVFAGYGSLFATLGAAVLVLGSAATCVSGEREAGTLDALRLTMLNRTRLLWAKLLTRIRVGVLFLLLMLPLWMLCIIVAVCLAPPDSAGGSATAGRIMVVVQIVPLFVRTLMHWGTFLGCAMFAVWLSVRCRSNGAALVLSYLCFLLSFFCCGLPVLIAGPILFFHAARNFDRILMASERL